MKKVEKYREHLENIGKYRELWDKDTKQLKKSDTFCFASNS